MGRRGCVWRVGSQPRPQRQPGPPLRVSALHSPGLHVRGAVHGEGLLRRQAGALPRFLCFHWESRLSASHVRTWRNSSLLMLLLLKGQSSRRGGQRRRVPFLPGPGPGQAALGCASPGSEGRKGLQAFSQSPLCSELLQARLGPVLLLCVTERGWCHRAWLVTPTGGAPLSSP